MAQFKYIYQKIVDLKTSEKTQAEWMLSSAIGKLQEVEASLEQLKKERQLWRVRLHESSTKVVSLSEIRVLQLYLDYLEQAIASKMADVHEAQRNVDDRRAQLTMKMKDEKVWLKSKDRALERYRSLMQAKEQNELDEIATVRYVAPTP